MTINHLLLTDTKKEDQDDELLASLTTIAYKTPQPLKKKVKKVQKEPSQPKEARKSRFFFKPTESFSSELNKSKKAISPKANDALTVLDAEVEARRKQYAKELPIALKDNIDAVREFFLTEIGPLALAAQAGTVQAGQVLQRVLNTEIDNQSFVQFERMVGKASTLKMARFIARYLDLPIRTVEELLQVVQPPPPKEVLFMNSDVLGERRVPKRSSKVENAEPQKE